MSNGDLLGFSTDLLGGGFEGGGGEITTPTIPIPTPQTGDGGLLQFAKGVGGGIGKGWDWLTSGTGPGGQPTQTSPLSTFTQLLGLGATGLGVATGLGTQRQLAKQTEALLKGQKTAQVAAAPAVAAGREQLAETSAGKLPPPMEAAVEQWKQQAKADMRARFAQMGLGQSTDLQHEEERIDLMGESMKAQLLQSQEGLALEALQTGVSAGTGVAQTAQAQQTTLASLIQAANAQLGRLSGATP